MEAKVNLGALTRTVNIDGQSIVQVPGDVTQVGAGGLLALPTNMRVSAVSAIAT